MFSRRRGLILVTLILLPAGLASASGAVALALLAR